MFPFPDPLPPLLLARAAAFAAATDADDDDEDVYNVVYLAGSSLYSDDWLLILLLVRACLFQAFIFQHDTHMSNLLRA